MANAPDAFFSLFFSLEIFISIGYTKKVFFIE